MTRLPASVCCVLLVGASAIVSCGQSVQSTSPRSAVPIAASRVQGPFVQAGTSLTLQLESALRSDTSRPGDPFTAVVIAPLHAGDGGVVVAAGARVSGHVVAVDHSGGSLRVAFDDIETLTGPSPLVATIDRSEQVALLGTEPDLGAPGDTRIYRRFAYPGTAPDYLAYPSAPVVVVAPGALLRVRLTRPLVPPGSRVEHPAE